MKKDDRARRRQDGQDWLVSLTGQWKRVLALRLSTPVVLDLSNVAETQRTEKKRKQNMNEKKNTKLANMKNVMEMNGKRRRR
jgi:hypothetical protein